VGTARHSRSVPHTREGLGDSGLPEIRGWHCALSESPRPLWKKVPADIATRAVAKVMCREAHERNGPRRWSSASFLPISNRSLVQLGTSQESGQQQSCSKHAKRRWRRFQSNVRRCTSSTPLDHSLFPIHCPPQLRSNPRERSTYFCQLRLRHFAGRISH
jgi:hypothetical protein